MSNNEKRTEAKPACSEEGGDGNCSHDDFCCPTMQADMEAWLKEVDIVVESAIESVEKCMTMSPNFIPPLLRPILQKNLGNLKIAAMHKELKRWLKTLTPGNGQCCNNRRRGIV